MADDGPTEPTRGTPADPPGLRGRDLLGLGGLLVGCVVVGLVAGLLVDHATGRSPLFTLVGIAVGIVAAAVGFAVRVRAAIGGAR